MMLEPGGLTVERIGGVLRTARIERGLATEEIAWKLKVRPQLIRTLERRDPSALAQPSIVRAHLASYARALGLEEKPILEAFDAGVGETATNVDALEEQARSERHPPRARWLAAAVFSAVAIAVAASTGVLGTEAEPVTTDVQARVPLAVAGTNVIRLEIIATEATEISIIADGTQVFEGTLAPSAPKRFQARDELKVVAADAGAVEVEVNGQRVRTGGRGVAFSAIFGPGGVRR